MDVSRKTPTPAPLMKATGPARGVSVHPLRARNVHPVLTRISIFCGVLSLLLIASDLTPTGFLLGSLLAILPVPFYVVLALWLDRFEAEPVGVLARTFLWGATVAVLVALLINGYADGVVDAAFGAEVSRAFGLVISAPVAEELGKGLALLILYLELHDEFDGVTDGVVYAAMVGLGFAMVENIQYYGAELSDGFGANSVPVFVVRGMMAPFAHPLFTSMFGIGLGMLRESPHGSRRWWAPGVGFALAVLLHSLWNLASLNGWFLLAYLVVMVPAFVCVLWLIQRSLRREGEVLREHLLSLVEEGWIEPDELECLCHVRRRLRATSRAFWTGGLRRWSERRELHQVASELAFHRWRVRRGLTLGHAGDVAREEGYLRRLRELCTERSWS